MSDDVVAVVRMTGGQANAMTNEMLDTIERLVDEFEGGPASVAVLTGYSKYFSAGLPLPSLRGLDRAAMRAFMERFTRTMMRVFTCEKPIVAAINGHAIARTEAILGEKLGTWFSPEAQHRLHAAAARMNRQ